jgi:menaquinone-dependent protoporphyrinogen IX oxidase
VKRAGGDIDTSRDYEYTDWVALDHFVEEFSGKIKALDLPAEIPESRQ